MTQRLGQVQEHIDRFVREARKCAQCEMGFAATLTIFPVVLGVSEAIAGRERPDLDLIESFLREMPDPSGWMVMPQSTANLTPIIAEKLAGVRNGLAHASSLPSDVRLANDMEDAARHSKQHPSSYIVSVTDFVEAVEITAANLIKLHPDATFDRRSDAVERGVADRDKPTLNGSSGSAAMSSTSHNVPARHNRE